MILLMRFFVSYACFLPLLVFSQTFQYKIEGSYSVETFEGNSGTLSNTIPSPPPVSNVVTVNYTLRWNESANLIQGLYQDNFFASSPNVVSGNVMNAGRTFSIILPNLINNVKSIAIRTNQAGVMSGSVQTDIRTMNNVGGVLNTISSYGYMTSISSLASTAPASCSIGFGTLTGFCGIYSGSVTEISDASNRCNLTQDGTPRLQLGTDTNFTLFLNPVSDSPYHSLGTFITSPDGNSISLSRRHCGVLDETTFPADDCKILSLNASFFNQAGNISASGNYTITDELTGEACSYNMFLTRQVAF